MCVCPSVTGLRLKHTGLRLVYILLTRAAQICEFMHSSRTFGCVPLMVPSRWRTQRIEDKGRLENMSRKTEDD